MTCTNVPAESNIRLVGCDGGDTFHLLGEDAGVEGVNLLEDGFDGLIEAQIVVMERTPVRMDGAILRAVKTAVMQVTLEVSIDSRWVNDSFGEVDGALREAFSFELDRYYKDSTLARIEWETADGVRWIDVVLAEGQDYQVSRDPHKRGWWTWKIALKAYEPFWKATTITRPLVFTEPGVQQVEISNLSGVPMRHKWVGGVAQWRLPDNSWSGRRWNRAPGGRFPTRTVLYPALTELNGGIVVDYTPGELMVRDKHDTNLIATMPVPGDYPKHHIPEFTQKQTLSVEAVSVPPGGAAMVLHLPRRFRRPWGRV